MFLVTPPDDVQIHANLIFHLDSPTVSRMVQNYDWSDATWSLLRYFETG